MKGDGLKHIKVLFEVEDGVGGVELESLWAVPLENGYQLDNVPFYARGIACGDVVRAIPDEGGMLRFTEIISVSGHSTVRLWFADREAVRGVRRLLREMGCSSELEGERLVAIDIPPNVPYAKLKPYLEQQEHLGIFEYEEGCLSQDIGT